MVCLRLSSTKFTLSTLEYFIPYNITQGLFLALWALTAFTWEIESSSNFREMFLIYSFRGPLEMLIFTSFIDLLLPPAKTSFNFHAMV